MSRASEWAASGEKWRVDRPTFEGASLRATVTEKGNLSAGTTRDYGQNDGAEPAEVQAFICWLRATFE